MDAPTNFNNKFALLQAWKEAKEALDRVKLAEADMRKQVVEVFSEHFDGEIFSGMENIDVGQGYNLKIEHSLDYKLDQEKIESVLDEIEAKIEGGAVLAERLCKVKYELSVSEYKKLPEAARLMVDKILTIKPASKSVKLAERKR